MFRSHHKKHINHIVAILLVLITLFATASIIFVKFRYQDAQVSTQSDIL